ncbi:MAG: single-stranded DNA-binding protein [Clostridiales bacterium]|nr:single-stranded DNA-binding protein [Candidatus Cacconaster stercorequi]
MDNSYNRVRLCGRVLTAPVLSHINHGVTFCCFMLSVPRLSGQSDDLRILAPCEMVSGLIPGRICTVTGQLRSFNNRSGVGPRLVISVFARGIVPGGEFPYNCIQLSGVLCREPSLRRTPLGREICDLTLAVNRRYGRADYLPCIAWGAVAQATAAMRVGDCLTAEGRVQSRTYNKNLGTTVEQRVAYEVSIMRPAAIEEFAGI